MVNKLFNYLVDNLYQISKVRNLRETFKLMSSVHPVVNWNFLKQNKEIIDCPEWMKKCCFTFCNSNFVIKVLYMIF